MKFLSSLLIAGTMIPISLQAQKIDKWANSLPQRLDSIIKYELPKGANVAMLVYDLTADSIVYDYQADKLSRPASNMKLVTTISALAHPGADEPFRTEVWYQGTIKKNTLHGDIYVIGAMDPEFDDAAMDSMANVIAALPFNKVKGRLYGDISMKDSIYWGSGWAWDDTPYSYQPYLSPLMLNKGVVEVTAHPTTKGQPAKLTCIPSSSYYSLINETQSFTETTNTFSVSRNWLENGNDVVVKGNVTRERSGVVNIFGSEHFFMHTLQERLEARGMEFDESYAFKEMQKNEQTILVMAYETAVQDIVNQLMKESDNLNTEAILYRLGVQASGHRHVNAEDGLKAVRARIDSLGLEADNYRVADGCGLSNYNAVSPELLVALLRFAHSRPDIYPKLYQSLPIAGVDGTLKSRMKEDTPSYKNVHAKTGTISGISTLSGYLTAPNGHEIAFSIMNQNQLTSRSARIFQDKICDAMTTD